MSDLHDDTILAEDDDEERASVCFACFITIWGVVVIGYSVCWVILQRYGYDMSYGMVVFLVPAIAITILFIIMKVLSYFGIDI